METASEPTENTAPQEHSGLPGSEPPKRSRPVQTNGQNYIIFCLNVEFFEDVIIISNGKPDIYQGFKFLYLFSRCTCATNFEFFGAPPTVNLVELQQVLL